MMSSDKILNQIEADIKTAKDTESKLILIITTTSKEEPSFLSPIRKIEDYIIIGVVVNNSATAENIIESFENEFSYIFIDIEKKLSPILIDKKIDTRNILRPVLNKIQNRIKLRFIKPNSLTIESTLTIIEEFLFRESDLTVGIIGCGNIGSGLAYRLSNIGVNLILYNRTIKKSLALHNSLIQSKPTGSISTIQIQDSIEKTLIVSEIILLCANVSKPIIQIHHLPFLKNKKLVLDIGKRSISERVINKLPNLQILSVENELKKFIQSNLEPTKTNTLKSEELINFKIDDSVYNRLIQNGNPAVKNSIIVDDIHDMKTVVAIVNEKKVFSRPSLKLSNKIINELRNRNSN